MRKLLSMESPYLSKTALTVPGSTPPAPPAATAPAKNAASTPALQLAEPKAFRANIQSFQSKMLGGQGCYLADANTVDIFPQIVDAFGHDPNKEKIVIAISDGLGGTRGLDEIVDMLQQNDIKMHVLGMRGKFGEPGAHELLADLTGGQFWELKHWEASGDFFHLMDDTADTIREEISKQMADGRISQGTDMGEAMSLLAEALAEEQMEERGLPPVLVLISDGQPSDDFQLGLNALLAERWGDKAVRIAIYDAYKMFFF